MVKKYDIYEHIGNISNENNGWTKELNLISWDDREPVYDIMTLFKNMQRPNGHPYHDAKQS